MNLILFHNLGVFMKSILRVLTSTLAFFAAMLSTSGAAKTLESKEKTTNVRAETATCVKSPMN